MDPGHAPWGHPSGQALVSIAAYSPQLPIPVIAEINGAFDATW